VLWVAGCARGCAGCVAGPILGPEAGEWHDVSALADEILRQPDTDGLTLSGGEPFEQAEALAELCQVLRASRAWSVMSYSGFQLHELRADPARSGLLGQLDLLVDGAFDVALQADLRWRGSSNQRIHHLSDRHRLDEFVRALDVSAGVEMRIGADGRTFWAGVPPRGFQSRLEASLARQGVLLAAAPETWT
jgi:anaerobic ribonucleoside-triphosphate reductase activating protein